MLKRSLLWLWLVVIADLFSLFLLADFIGAGWTLLWVLLAMVLGVLVIIDAGDTLRTLGGLFATPMERLEAIRETPWLLLVGVLLFTPGLLSDLAALALWWPGSRRWLIGRKAALGSAKASAAGASARSSGEESSPPGTTVIEGEWVEKSSKSLGQDPSR